MPSRASRKFPDSDEVLNWGNLIIVAGVFVVIVVGVWLVVAGLLD